MDLDLIIDSGIDVSESTYMFPINRTVELVSSNVSELKSKRLLVNVMITSDAGIQRLNLKWRGKDRPTNILSFPFFKKDELFSLVEKGPSVMLGDLVFGHEILCSEAKLKNISLADHISHLTTHGLLHLAGYDHEINDEEADKMEELEIRLLAMMGIADPYIIIDTRE